MKFLQLLRRASQSSFKAGEIVKETRTITQQELQEFSNLTGDHNPIHTVGETGERPLVHGAFLNGIVAGIIGSFHSNLNLINYYSICLFPSFSGTKLPGPGTIVISQNFSFPSKCFTDDPIDILIKLVEVRKILRVTYQCSQNGVAVFEGDAKLMMNKKS